MAPDELKRAVCEKAFSSFDGDATIFRRRRKVAEDTYELEEMPTEIVDSGDLYRVLRVGTPGGPRYFQVSVKEMM